MNDTTHSSAYRRKGHDEAMIELQLLAALDALDRAREQILVALPRRLGSPRTLAIAGGVALGWLARDLTLWSAR